LSGGVDHLGQGLNQQLDSGTASAARPKFSNQSEEIAKQDADFAGQTGAPRSIPIWNATQALDSGALGAWI
jgi:hypothetical protein